MLRIIKSIFLLLNNFINFKSRSLLTVYLFLKKKLSKLKLTTISPSNIGLVRINSQKVILIKSNLLTYKL